MLHYAGIARCGINVICDANQVELKLVDVGIKGDVLHPRIDNRKLMGGNPQLCQRNSRCAAGDSRKSDPDRF